MIFFLFHSFKGVRKIYLFQLVSWKSVVFGIYFWNTTAKLKWWKLSLASPKTLWIGGASERWWPSCSYRKCPQGGSTSLCPALVPLIPEPRFMGCGVEWNMPEQTPKGWCLTTSSPEASTLLPILKLPGHCSLLWFLGVHCQEAGFSWDSRSRRPGSGWLFPVVLVREMGYCVLCVLGILFPARENQTTLFRGDSLRTPCMSVDSCPVSPSLELNHTQVLAMGSQTKSGRLGDQSGHSFSFL